MQQPPRNFTFAGSRTFASLRHPNFRLWFVGQMISLFGSWMQITALGYYSYEITGSKEFLGWIAVAAGLPTLLFMFVGGMAADHIPRRLLLVMTQSALMVLAFVLAALTFFKVANPYLLLAIAACNGVANSFDAPARQSFLLEMVNRESLTNAIALNSTMFNVATAVGPALGGGAYALFGPAGCFFINGVSFLAVIIALLLMRLPGTVPISSLLPAAPIKNILSGFKYIVSERRIGAIILAAMMVSFFGFSVYALFPAWAVEMLRGDETTNGFLQSARGLGALAAAVFIASRGNITHRWKWMLTGMFVFPAALIAFSFVTVPLVSYAFVFVTGLGMMTVFNLANAMIQIRVKDEFRGRVMSAYSLTFFAFAPFGSLLLGAVADAEGVGAQPVVFGAASILFAFAAAAFFFLRRLRSS